MKGGGRAGAGPFGGFVALLVVTGAALFASATAGDPRPESTSSPAPSIERAQELADRLTPMVARRVERIRGLQFDRIPQPTVVTGEQFAEISARAARLDQGARRELGDAAAAARLFGLMEPQERLDRLADEASDLAAAAYDTEADRLYVIFDASGDSPELLEFLLAHELDHALADQLFGIDELGASTDDAALAELALVEGSATAVMQEYAQRHLNPFALAAATAGLDAGTEGVPRFYVEGLTWAYLRGAGFVNALRDRTDDWRFVDGAFESMPPVSTEQVFHARRYFAAEQPLSVNAGAGFGDWKSVAQGTLGEFSTQQVLALGAPAGIARGAAEGWGGDEYVLLSRGPAGTDCRSRCRQERALVLEWRGDSPGEAREFERVLPAYLVGGLEAVPVGSGEWKLDDSAIVARRAGDAVRVAFAPTAAVARGLRE